MQAAHNDVQGRPGDLRPEQDRQHDDLIVYGDEPFPALGQGKSRHGCHNNINHRTQERQCQAVEQGPLEGDPGLLGDFDQVREIAQRRMPHKEFRRIRQDLIQGLECGNNDIDQGQQHKSAHDDQKCENRNRAAGGAAQGCAFANLCHALPPYNHLDSSLLMSVHMISINPNSTTATAQA